MKAELERRYGSDGAGLIEKLDAMSRLTGRNLGIAFNATALLLAYLKGKPPQPVTGEDGGAIQVTNRMIVELRDA